MTFNQQFKTVSSVQPGLKTGWDIKDLFARSREGCFRFSIGGFSAGRTIMKTEAQRFWSKVSISENGCWEWTGAKFGTGYGLFTVEKGTKSIRAHRWSYANSIKPLTPGLVLDHLCRNRGCVNPLHLEEVTHRENIKRGIGPSAPFLNGQNHCARGHEFTAENTKIYNGKRQCRICRRVGEKRRRLSSAPAELSRLSI